MDATSTPAMKQQGNNKQLWIQVRWFSQRDMGGISDGESEIHPEKECRYKRETFSLFRQRRLHNIAQHCPAGEKERLAATQFGQDPAGRFQNGLQIERPGRRFGASLKPTGTQRFIAVFLFHFFKD